MRKVLDQLIDRIIPILHQHDVIHAAVFGSFAREQQRENSDLDILVEFGEGKSLLDLVALKLELEELLERKVDIATYNSLHPDIREAVLEEQITVI